MRKHLTVGLLLVLAVVVTQSAGSSFPAPGGWPTGMAYDGNVLYVYDAVGFRPIYRMDPGDGTPLGSFSSGGTLGALAFDGVDRLFVSDLGGLVKEIAIAEPDGVPHTVFNDFVVPFRVNAIAFDGSNLYLHDWDSGRFMVTDRMGAVLADLNTGLRIADMVFDPATGNIWALNIFAPTISEITTSGALVRQCENPVSTGAIGAMTLVGSDLYIAQPDTVEPPGTIFVVHKGDLVCDPPLVQADAGADQAVMRGDRVTLDGSASSDAGGNTPLTFAWTITTAPAGSMAALDDPSAVSPSFVADLHGDYAVELVVTNSIGESSAPDEVAVSTVNTAPSADAGPDRVAFVLFEGVVLDGTGSTDDDGDSLLFEWSVSDAPPGSTPTLTGSATATPTLTPDSYGTYVLQLLVTDVPLGAVSAPDSVLVSFDNLPPVAEAGTNDSVVTHATVFLDGTGSSDPNQDLLTYSWALTSVPDGSVAVLSNSTAAMPTFVADVPGPFVVSLVVNDGGADSPADSATILALTPTMAAQERLMAGIDLINAVPDASFKNANQRNALTNMITAALDNIGKGNLTASLSQLNSNGLLGKVDGCAVQGSPDRNDWIVICEHQEPVYECLIEAIQLLLQELGGQ